jgi:hypothetical protein
MRHLRRRQAIRYSGGGFKCNGDVSTVRFRFGIYGGCALPILWGLGSAGCDADWIGSGWDRSTMALLIFLATPAWARIIASRSGVLL